MSGHEGKKICIIALLIVAFICQIQAASSNLQSNLLEKHRPGFQQFKLEYSRQYEDKDEEHRRFNYYAENMEKIEEFNKYESDYSTYELGPNSFLDRSPEEIEEHAFGFKIPKNYFDSIDWREKEGRVSEVKDQGACGSCWAFATTGLLEGQEDGHKTATTSGLTELSEQDLVDCSKQNYGCQGGLMNTALEDISKLGGIESETDYPYHASSSRKCRFEQSKSVMSDKGAYVLTEKSEEKLKEVVAKYGPVAVAIHAGQFRFMFYKRGVFYDRFCKKTQDSLNHAVLVVGYGHDDKGGDYWIVKNSWGRRYGESGYIRMARNRNNHCGIALLPTIATF